MSAHWVYRMFDGADDLLYVGMTGDPKARLAHWSSKGAAGDHWFQQVARVDWHEYADRPSASVAERAAIRAEGPRCNIRLQAVPVGAAGDDLNRTSLEALMVARGVDGYADLAKRTGVERSYVSRILRGERPAKPSQIVAFARALQVPTLAITGTGIDISVEDLVDADGAA